MDGGIEKACSPVQDIATKNKDAKNLCPGGLVLQLADSADINPSGCLVAGTCCPTPSSRTAAACFWAFPVSSYKAFPKGEAVLCNALRHRKPSLPPQRQQFPPDSGERRRNQAMI